VNSTPCAAATSNDTGEPRGRASRPSRPGNAERCVPPTLARRSHRDRALPALYYISCAAQFTTLRLLARDRDHVEITHEALLQAWPRLRSWLDDDRAGNITRQEVEQAASEWVGSQRDPDLLYRGLRLEAAKSWQSTSVSDIGSDVRHFIDTSAVHAARRQRIRQTVLALLVTLTLVAATGGAVALQQAHIAGEQAYIAGEQERLAFTSAISANADRLRNDDISTAAQLDLRAHGMQPDGTTYANLVESGNATLSHPLEGHAADVMSVAYSPDGRTLVTGGADQSVRFWTLGGAAGPVLSGLVATARPVLTVAFGSAGKSVVVGESGGGIEVFSLRDRSRIGPVLQAHTGNVNALTYSEQTGLLASAGDDGRIRFWSSNQDLSLEPTGRDIPSSGTEVLALDFDGFGSALVAGGADGSTTTWDVRNINGPYRLATMNHHEDRVTAVGFSADGRLLATGSWDDTVQVVNSQDKTTLKIESDYLEPGVSAVTSVAFSPTGTTLAVAGYSGEIVMYSLADPATPRVQWMPLRRRDRDVRPGQARPRRGPLLRRHAVHHPADVGRGDVPRHRHALLADPAAAQLADPRRCRGLRHDLGRVRMAAVQGARAGAGSHRGAGLDRCQTAPGAAQ
jgi:WD40 repeat protein